MRCSNVSIHILRCQVLIKCCLHGDSNTSFQHLPKLFLKFSFWPGYTGKSLKMSQWFGKIWHSKKRSQFQCMSQTKPNWPLWTTLPIVNITAGRRSRNIRKVMPNLHILSVGNPLDPFLYCGNFCGRRLRAKTEIIVQRLWEKRTKRQIIVWRFWEKCTKRQIIVCWGGYKQ